MSYTMLKEFHLRLVLKSLLKHIRTRTYLPATERRKQFELCIMYAEKSAYKHTQLCQRIITNSTGVVFMDQQGESYVKRSNTILIIC